MLVYLLFYALIHQSRCAVIDGGGRTVIRVPLAGPTSSEELSFPPTRLLVTGAAERENLVHIRLAEAIHTPAEQHSVSLVDNTRDGYERDLMVVLPVMQGNSDMTNSKLQVLYTKPPVTAIIGDDSKDLLRQAEPIATARAVDRRADVETSSKETTDRDQHPYMDFLIADKPAGNKMRVIEKRIEHDESKEAPSGRHPYTEFLFSKTTTAKTRKSPLDYGYPESFKFVQELNELPKNHKPEWASTDGQEFGEYSPTTTGGPTKGDPFQMFESVKPLEINKLLAPKPLAASATDSIGEEGVTEIKKKQEPTEAPTRVKRPQQKRPPKKPQKSKPSSQKPVEDDTPSPTSTPPPKSTTTESSSPVTKVVEISQNSFLPTPTTGDRVAAIVKEILGNTTTTQFPPPRSNPVGLNLLWAHAGATSTTTELNPVKIVNEVKPADLISLSRILGENFTPEPTTTTTKAPDDFLNDDMRNMLQALGIIRSEVAPYLPFSTTPRTTTVGNYLFNVFGKRERATPTVDPLSYVTFKKMPGEYEPPRDRVPVSDDMKDLLASFGLLPKRTNPFGNTIFGRLSRQRRLDTLNTTEESVVSIVSTKAETEGKEKEVKEVKEETEEEENFPTEIPVLNDTSAVAVEDDVVPLPSNETSILPPMNVNVDMLTDDMRSTLENLGLILPLPYSYQPNRNAHVFQPSAHLDKLGDRQKIEKINEAIDHIRKLSKSKETYKLTVEEIEKKLENVTALLNDNSTLDGLDDALNTSISNATASKVVETLQKIPIADNLPSDNYDFNFTSDESSINVINLNSTEPESSEPGSTELNVVMSPPNPLSPEELQQLLETNKNEVKRQEPANDTSTAATTTTTEEVTTVIAESSSTSTTASSTESSTRAESNNAPISDLADSFGGGETASEEPSASLDASTERPNGLYFYLDWNTFLNVGEADKNPVRIRFAPKAGNARNFLPITVP